MQFLHSSLATAWLAIGFATGTNVLFITIDDLRPDLGCYAGSYFPSSNDPAIYTPNIDKLASKSLLLKRAYVQQAICSPSRTSFLTSRRPDTTKAYDLRTYFRQSGGNFTTIPQYFKENGYVSLGFGKIFHHGSASGNDDPISWTDPVIRPSYSSWETGRSVKSWMSVTQNQTDQDPLYDMQVAKNAVQTLQEYAKGKYGNKPLFLAAGFRRPHLPFVFPSQFQNHYPLSEMKPPKNPYAPYGMPDIAWVDSPELRRHSDINTLSYRGHVNESLPMDVTLDLRRAYFSSVSFIDSLVGDIIDELKRLGFENDTIVSLVGDHGYHLGEHGIWAKKTNFEVGTHAPLMIRVPGATDAGVVSTKITEFVDLFPTLVDAAGLPPLSVCPKDSSLVSLCTEGESLLPLVRDPYRSWKSAAFSQFPRDMYTLDVMGYSIRTDSHRYTEWVKFNKTLSMGDWNHVVGAELYDHNIDTDENRNIADDPNHASLRQDLRQQLRQGWMGARPPLIG